MDKKSLRSQPKHATMTIRISHLNRFALELTARKQHRTVSSVLDWAIERALLDDIAAPEVVHKKITHPDGTIEEWDEMQPSLLQKLWSEHEYERLLNFAKYAPDLMSYEQKSIWALIKTNDQLWNGGDVNPIFLKACWDVLVESVDLGNFDEAKFDAVAESTMKKLKAKKKGADEQASSKNED